MAILLKTALVRVSSIQIMQVRVQNKGKSIWKSRYDGDVSAFRNNCMDEEIINAINRRRILHFADLATIVQRNGKRLENSDNLLGIIGPHSTPHPGEKGAPL